MDCEPPSPSDALPAPEAPQLLRALGVPTAVAMVVGNTIGSGIFVKPGIIAQQLGDFSWIMVAWVLGGVLCMCGGLCYAELAAMLPRAGGLYVYLREAYGSLVGFLFGWNELLFNRPAASGALSIIFVRSLAAIVGRELSNLQEIGLAMLAIGTLAFINILGVKWGGAVQVGTTAIKVGFVVAMILLPILLLPSGQSDFTVSNWRSEATPQSDAGFAARFGVVLLAVMWAYNGWAGVTPVAEEIRHPERNVPLALFLGIGLIVLLYLGANLAYHGVLPMSQVMAAGERTAETMLQSLLGSVGASAMAVVLVFSTIGAMNGDLLIAPRISFAMGRDRVFFRSFAWVHPVYHTPVVAIGIQGAMSSLLVLGSGLLVEFSPTFEQDSVFELLTNFVIFAASIFYALTVLAVIVLRYRRPDRARPYRTWGYPLVPAVFLGVYAWFLWQVYAERPFESQSGLLLIALGVPAYFAFAAYNRRR